MKRLITLLLLLASMGAASAQNWAPFPAELDIQWFVDNGWLTGEGCWIGEQYNYKVEPEVAFNGHTYFPISYTGTHYSQFTDNPETQQSCTVWPPQPIQGVRAYLRAEGGVYYKGWQGGEEVLYDFSLEIGDTLRFQTEEFVVDSIDEIQIGTHSRVRQWVSQDWGSPVWIIEGIGHQHGLFESLYQFENSSSIRCYWENGAPMLPGTSSCGYLDSQEVSPPEFSLYPNPSSGIFRMETTKASSYWVYDLFGRIITQGQLNGISELDLTSQPNGIYLISVENEKGISTAKLVKH
ncbi:MAG: T9SS type A sorting domain-containing protein [Flavobacteriales bacterium]|nr:T9SS type A sorting domain-containing protein [Flavobacteriales bacterium]